MALVPVTTVTLGFMLLSVTACMARPKVKLVPVPTGTQVLTFTPAGMWKRKSLFTPVAARASRGFNISRYGSATATPAPVRKNRRPKRFMFSLAHRFDLFCITCSEKF
jgi:hypothetical protein